MKAKRSLLLLSLGMVLASCGGRTPPTPILSDSSTPAATSTPATTSTPAATTSEGEQSTPAASSSTPAAEQYVIAVNVSSGLKLKLNKTKASKGERIEITVESIEEGYTLEAIYANGSKLNADDKGVYAFNMPNRSVTITADVKMTGDVTINGDVTAKLVEEVEGSGVYVARNVKVETKALLYFQAFGKSLTMVDIDHTKCLADIQYASSKTDKKVAFALAGGSTYDFFYDDNADVTAGRCYVRRAKVDTYPADPESLLSLFDGHSRSESTENPADLLSIDYTNGITDIAYKWDNYVDGSLGVAKKASNKDVEVGVNYRKINEGVYATADTYLEYPEHRVPGSSDKKMSARYGIVNKTEDILPGYGRYSITEHDADFLAHHSGHATESIRFDLMDSFYIGFDTTPDLGTDGLGLFARNITSTAEEGGFKVVIDSYREIDTTNVLNAVTKEISYYKYDATIHFDTKGQLLSASYIGKRYDEVAYSFATHTLIDPETFVKVADLDVTYTYGEALGSLSYDDSNLFSSKISAIVRDEHVIDPALKDTNAIAVKGDSGDDTVNAHMTLSSNLGEEEFLDMDNYTIIDYGNSNLLYQRTESDPFTLLPRQEGKVNITIGNPMVASAPTCTFELTIEDAVKVRSFFMVGEDGQWSASQDLLDTSQSFTMPAGKVRRFQVWGSPGDAKNVPFTPVSNDPDVKVERYVVKNQAFIKFDATQARITQTKTVKVTIQSDRYLEGFNPTVFTVTLVPGSDFNPYGDWYLISSFDETKDPWEAADVNRNVKASLVDYNVSNVASTVTITSNNKTSTYSFGLHINDDTGVAEITKIKDGNVSEVYLTETVDGYLGIILIADDATWSGLDDVTDPTIVLGNLSYDDEGQLEYAEYASFDLVSNWDLVD